MPDSGVVGEAPLVAAGLRVGGTQSRPPGCTDDRELGTVPPSSSPQASQAPDPASCTRTFLQRSCGQTRKGAQPEKQGEPAPSAPRPRAAQLPGPPGPPPSDLAVHRDGVGGDDERLLAALGFVLLGLLLGQSRVERHLHHGGAGVPTEGGGGLEARLSELSGTGGSAAGRQLLRHRSRSPAAPGRGRSRLAQPRAGAGPGRGLCRGRGLDGEGRGLGGEGRGWLGSGRSRGAGPAPASRTGDPGMKGGALLGADLDFLVLSSLPTGLPDAALQFCREIRHTFVASRRAND